MTDFISGGGTGHNLLGRRIIIVLPVVLIFMIVFFLFMSLPVRYYYKMEHGQLYLKTAKMGWLDESTSKAFRPVPVEGLGPQDIPTQVFETESEALKALREQFSAAAEKQCLETFELEKNLVKPYQSLLTKFTIAHAAGAAEYGREMMVLKGWLQMHAEKMEKLQTVEQGTARPSPDVLESDAIVPEAARESRTMHP